MQRTLITIPTLMVSLALAAGCSDSSSPSNSDFTADLTADVGAAQADEVDQSAGSLTLAASFGACATVDNTADTDHDGAPDNATFTFALPACSFSNVRGGTLEITGTVTLSDPTPNNADVAYLATLDNFSFHYTNATTSRSFTATRNGTRALTTSGNSVSLANDVTTVRSVTGRADATISHNTVLTFTPDDGLSLEPGAPPPSGTLLLTGSLTWSRNAQTHTFTATTVVPLRWDASCSTDRKISAGEIHWTQSNGSYIKMVWTGCGIDPTVTFVAASAA